MSKKRPPRSVFIKILVICALIGLSVAAIRPVQSALLKGMTRIRTNFIEKIEVFTGLEIRYSSIRPTIFGSFDIRNIRVLKNKKVILTISRVRIYFSLSDLLQGRKSAIRNIQIEKPQIILDLEKDSELFEFLSTLQNKQVDREFLNQINEFLPENPDYKIQDFFITLTNGNSIYQVNGMNLHITGKSDDIFLYGTLTGEYIFTGIVNRTYSVRTDVNLNGVYSSGLQDSFAAKADIDFLDIRGIENNTKVVNGIREIFSVRPLGVDLFLDNKSVSIRPLKTADADYRLDYNFESGNFSAALGFDNFVPAQFISFSGFLQQMNHLLSMSLTGKASFESENENLRYSVDFHSGENFAYEHTFALRANGNEKKIVIDEFNINSSANNSISGPFQGRLFLSGETEFSPLKPSGNLVFDRFSLTGDDFFHADFEIASLKNEILITCEAVSTDQHALNNIDIHLYTSDRDVVITAAGLNDEGNFNIDAIYNYNPRQLETSLNMNSFSLLHLFEMFRPFSDNIKIPSFAKNSINDTFIDAEVFFTTDFNHIVYNAPNVVLKRNGSTGVFSFLGTERQFTLSEGVFSWDNNEFMISSQVNFSNPNDLSFLINANYLDFSWHVQGQVLDKSTLIISDPNGLHVYGSVSNSGAISGYIEGVNFPVPVKSLPVYLNFFINLRFESKDFWSLDVARFEASDINSTLGDDILRISGSANQDGASFRELLYSDALGTLAGGADFSWDSDFSYLQFYLNMTDGRKDGEYYFAEGVLRDNKFSVKADVSQMRIDRFLTWTDRAFLNAEIEIKWDSINSFNAQLKLASFYAQSRDSVIQGSALVNCNNDELTISDLNFDIAAISASVPSLILSRTESFVKASADIQGYPYKKRLETKIELDVNFDDIASWLEIEKALNSFSGSLKSGNVKYGNYEQEPFAVVFARNEEGLSVSGGPKNMLRLDMDREGIFFASLSSPFPINGSIAGRYENGSVDAHCNDLFLDLSLLWDLVSSFDSFSIDSGYITGKLDVRGPILNPDFYGTARGSSLRFRIPSLVTQDIRPVPFNAVIEGNDINFGPVNIAAGSGSGTVSGMLQFDKWRPNNVSLDITVPRDTPVPCSFDVMYFQAKGDAAGKMSLTIDDLMNDKLFEVKGDIYTNNTLMGLNFEERPKSDEDDTSAFFVNMTVTSGPAVEFVWPESNPILRGNPEMGTVMRISLDTQAGQYSVNSDIKIRSGEISYMDRNFFIRQGSLVFRENEQQFEPKLTTRAELRDRADSGPVTISMIIENQPLFSFVPRFESAPALTQLEIYTLLGGYMANMAGDETGESTQRLLLTSATDILTQFLANTDLFSQFISVRQFERQVRNLLGLDMFSVRTRILQNAVSNSAMLGLAPVDRNRVGNYFDNTTVFMGKYVGQDMFIQGMLTMRYDENNLDLGGIRVEPDIGIELQGPFFNIRWDFFPYHPENWFVNDNSITIIWSKSF